MTTVRMLTSMAAAEWSYAPGDVVTVRPDVADAWVAAGIAAHVEAPVEAAAIEPPENTARPQAQPRKPGRPRREEAN